MTQNKKFTKTCSKCGAAKPQDAYSKTQWREAKLTKIKCVECSQKAWTASHDAFTERCKQQTVTSSAVGVPLWQTHTVEEAKRYQVEAPLDALPSECLKSFQAMKALTGAKQWWETSQRLSDSGYSTDAQPIDLQPEAFFFLGGGRTFFVFITKAISQELKLELMAAAHRDASHMGGRDAILGALKAQAVHWNQLKLDASWLVAKCQQCAARKTSGMCKAPCRTLPRPLQAGDVVGVDLKTVTPPSGAKDKWTMLVLRDFTSGRVWAWDLDDGQCLGNRLTELLQNRIFPPPKSMCTICSKAMPEFVTHPILFLNMFTLKIWTIAGTFTFVFVVRRQLRKGLTEVQTLLVRWYTETDVPLCVWSDNGSQFRSVVAESLRRAFNIEPRYIPAAHPQSNGLVEVTLGFRAGVGTVFLFPISVYVYIYIIYTHIDRYVDVRSSMF